MAGRGTFWVIVSGTEPTAFRARERETLMPSILGSTTNATSREPSPSCSMTVRARRYQAASSSAPRALARLSIWRRWRTSGKRPDAGAPTRWVGESGVRNPGSAASSASSSRIQSS